MRNEAKTDQSTRAQGVRRWLAVTCGLALVTVSVRELPILVLDSFDSFDTSLFWTPSALVRYDVFACILGVFVGANAVARRKPTVLFLRRFGSDGQLVISRLLKAGLGRRFRVVTLDDGRFPALSAPPLERWLTRLIPVIGGAAILAGGFIFSRPWVKFPDGGLGLDNVFRRIVQSGLTVIFTVLAVGAVHFWWIRHLSTRSIRDGRDVRMLLSQLASLRGFHRRVTLSAAQSTVVHVVDALWRETVRGALRTTDVALVDVSVPSEHLQWEIEQLDDLSVPRVFVAEERHLKNWISREHSPDEPGAAIASLVEAHSVLGYDGDNPLGGAGFRKNLIAGLKRQTSTERYTPRRRIMDRWLHTARSLALYVSAVVVASYLAPSLAYAVSSVVTGLSVIPLMHLIVAVTSLAAIFSANAMIWLLGLPVRRRLKRPTAPGFETIIWRRVLPSLFITVLLIVAALYFALTDSSPATRWLLIALLPTALAVRNWWRVTGLGIRDEVAGSVHPPLR